MILSEIEMTHQQLYDKLKKTSQDAYIFSETIHLHHGANRHKITKTALKKILALKSVNKK